MKFITFARDGEQLPGSWLGEGHIADLSSAFGSILELIEAGEEGLKTARRLAEDVDVHLSAAVELLAPIPRTRKNVFCVGRNYVDHVKEGARFPGAPSGVGYAMTPPQGLKDGDVVVAKIDRIGELTSPIKAV